ncbi:replicative DNA helicase [Mycoplasma crocodyli]|uniref:Replicative DNA helicase n=1 Tax=Mycoplasma crocodyli (strain ATCC 51981 / MP145) TaxID=512564 RepID=D5E5M6_MYCCM|nr:replicative DNA helicase [Mycoplasma crocodyli]ADE19624.1 replicative DNA helicase [Mycoplasma crocodyli MP145]
MKNNYETIHQSLETEKRVLGMILSNTEFQPEMLTYITEEEFFNPYNKEVFKIILNLQPTYGVVNSDEIVRCIKENDTMFFYIKSDMIYSFLCELVLNAGIVENRFSYYEKLVSLSTLRKIESSINNFNNYIVSNKNIKPDDAMRKLEMDLSSVSNKRAIKEYEDSKSVSNEYFDDLYKRSKLTDGELNGIASGYTELDNMTQGFKGGELIILAARPAMGKTAFALNIASNAATTKNVAFVSLEMASTQLIGRIYSSISGIVGEKLKKPSLLNDLDWQNLDITKTQIGNLKLFLDDSTTSHLNEIIWKIKRLSKTINLDLLVVDYLQLITSPDTKGENRQNEVSKISRSLKQLARELNIPVIALSQLSRSVETREDKRPIMSDLRESGSIEQDADMVMFLYRADYYNKQKNKESYDPTVNQTEICELIISKHRNGPTGKIYLGINLNTSKFINVQRQDPFEPE